MIALDQARTCRPPTTWSADMVKERLVEAFKVERRMPGDRRTIGSAWPAAVVHDFADMVHWTDPRERVLDDWSRSRGGVYAWEVSRMEQAHEWLRWIEGDDRKWLQAWAFARAYGKSLRAILMRRGIKRTPFYRAIERAALAIADRLNEQRVPVR
jgi:hypothetical protein